MRNERNVQLFTNKDFEKMGKEPAKKKSWLWVLLLLIVAAIVALICLHTCDKERTTPHTPIVNTVEAVINSPVATEAETVAGAAAETSSLAAEQSGTSAAATSDNAASSLESGRTVASGAAKPVADTGRRGDVDVLLMAKRVIRGDYGNGDERKMALKDNYQAIQNQVNLNYSKGDLYW
ncbi:MAG: hypothetical protein IKL54_00705 [Bacteroidaceae bacterium]|nr:hypothetical protein [Bacteroidaceae bacterium]